MRIEIPREAERFGANHIYGVQKVYELDSGLRQDAPASENSVIQNLPYETLYEIERDMAIVVPIRDERLKLLEGVLFGIPHQCTVIIVSNSRRAPVDRFKMERDAVETWSRFTQKQLLLVHQKDPFIARALAEAGYPYILDENDLVANGKAEGMIMATLLARILGKRYIGFIDADNYFPGAVYEYVHEYAAGFALSKSPYTMVRIAWHSKPKVVQSQLFFAKYGRTSVVTNRFLNQLISYYTGFETEVIRTGNAGEHAMTMELAMLLDYATGYAIEPYHYIDLLEKYGGVIESAHPEVMQHQVNVFQIESRNPHLHESKGEEHIDDMILSSLQVIYHSKICPEPIKREVLRELYRRGILSKGEEPAPPRIYPALLHVDLEAFRNALMRAPYGEQLETLAQRRGYRRRLPRPTVTPPEGDGSEQVATPA